ncbi:TonB-dependent receptor [Rhodanobacter sp. DHB23]|uniref:TonB-dependent receptor n=1 Tax=Rhodanobacter sp. DHB23 TaxID=2775923 RepID=UPI00177CE843|nr:TonB-dependent receptor [Rhodanobacter sp. DHB23]MBD8872942.1 TonB-dependent receptor [Rhodanobacter sp. DHB23]
MKSGRSVLLRQTSLASALGLLLASMAAHGQSTTSSIFGHVPVQAGESVTVSNGSGLSRTVGIDSQGRYNANQLPIGTYTVSLMRDGQVIQQRADVLLKVGVGSEVSFSGEAAAGGATNAKQLSGVSVSANAVPPIDVSSVDSRTVITADQLAKLPLAHTAEAVALLAPATNLGAGGAASTTGEPLISFGGSSSTENAYYLNGFNTTDPNNAEGGITLPYGSIDQEEVYTGGYSAQYGRSDGGVINMIGKSGTNDWHFGGQFLYEPSSMVASSNDTYYVSGPAPFPVPGNPSLYDPRNQNSTWSSVYDLYLGGPIIKDKLFFFASAEMTHTQGNSVNSVESGTDSHYKDTLPKWYAKVNWNITDSNLLELTGASEKSLTSGTVYNYDYSNLSDNGFKAYANDTKHGGDLWLAKFTSYITDKLTFTASYGSMKTRSYSENPEYDPSLTYVGGQVWQNPALNGGTPITNSQTVSEINNPGQNFVTTNLRMALTYALGDHTITAGIDNLRTAATDQDELTSGPGGYQWIYGYTKTPTVAINPGIGVGAPADYPNGASGYYAYKYIFNQGGNLFSAEHAEYIEDQWQVNDRLLLSIGLRDDGFTNSNASATPYMRQTKPQWAPRLGFSWDVFGDSSFKVFGNAGRYYLGSPIAPGDPANGYLATQQFYTYSGIAADGTPTGLTQMSAPVSANGAYGQTPDPRTMTATSLKAEDQDEFMLGFQKTAGPNWVYGAKLTRRILRHVIDDWCDTGALAAKAASEGITDANTDTCYYINPGEANTFAVQDPSGAFHSVTMSNADMVFPRAVRRYYGLETFLEHPFDGKWYGKISYTFSRSYGNSEGEGQSDIRAIGGTQNEDWDFPSLMVYADGPQGNDHTNVIKAYGYYAITPEWLVSANLNLTSGGPKYCLGFFPTATYPADPTDPVSYGSNYHFCNGQPSPPGASGRLPWMKQLDVGVHYRPAFADHKMSLGVDVINVFNGQAPLNLDANYNGDSAGTLNSLYGTPMVLQQPRYVRFGVTYDY